jgi:serine/threonine protein kinase/ABC-type phosphate/phosphonate transport system substrate-binding protein
MHAASKCGKCGRELSAQTALGQCPHCLFEAAEWQIATIRATGGSLLTGERKVGDYILGKQIGSGGMGLVYQAHQISLNRKVALKFVRDSQVASPALLRRFTIEAEAAARLHHPNIVRIHEISETDGQPFISMDLIEGESLKYLLAKGDFSIRKEDGAKSNHRSKQVAIARLIAKTARAVHHAHERGVLHRDLKPANILIEASGEPQLTDFGLAKIIRPETNAGSAGTTLTAAGDIAGTPSYMAPEQVSSSPTTCCSDVYGLGAILYEMLTGHPPFQGATPLETLRHVQETLPRHPRGWNPSIDRDLETICLKCLEKDPGYRYTSAQALAEDLDDWLAHKPIKARKAGIVRRTTHWIKRNPVGATFIVTLFFGLLASLAILKMVKGQKDKIDVHQAFLFDQVIRRMSDAWKDPKTDEITVESQHLAILAGGSPSYNLQGHTLSLGIAILGDPVSFAQWRAQMLGMVEMSMSQALHSTIMVDLRLFKQDRVDETEALAAGKADFMMISPVVYVRAKARGTAITPIARENRELTGVIMANRYHVITNLNQLRGGSLAFGEAEDTLSIFGKAKLLDAGLTKRDFAVTSNFVDQIEYLQGAQQIRQRRKVARRETVFAVTKGLFDAGVTTLRRFELEKHRGLDEVSVFESFPDIFVARPGVDPRLISAFREALISLKTVEAPPMNKESFDWDGPFPGAAAIQDSDLDPLRTALEKAARFDGVSRQDFLDSLPRYPIRR